MAYDEAFAERVRTLMVDAPGFSERKMFGGICFMVQGHMACGVVGDRLMLRLGNDGAADALEEPHTAPMDFTGRVMRSMLYVEPAGLKTAKDLRKWTERAIRFALTQPPK